MAFSDQLSDGEDVVIEEVTLDDGGFVAIYDEADLETEDGAVPSETLSGDDVIGVSEYLEPGTHETVTAELREVPRTPFDGAETEVGNHTLVAVVHQNTTDDGAFEFAATDGAEDVPYADDGQRATSDRASVGTFPRPASGLGVQDQEGDGTAVTVDSAFAESAFYLEARYHGETARTDTFEANDWVRNETITLEPPVEDDTTIEVAVIHDDEDEELIATEFNYTVGTSEPDGATTGGTPGDSAPAPFFDISIAETNGPVEAGETISVTADVENTGAEDDQQEIVLDLDDETVATETVDIGSGESETITLQYETQEADIGDHEAIVASDDEADSTTVTIEPASGGPGGEAYFNVSITETNSPIEAGEMLNVTATVANTGNESDDQEITLDVGNQTVDRENVSLDGGDNETLTLAYNTTEEDVGDVNVTVESTDDEDATTVTVEPGQSDGLERVSPDPEITVAPGSTVVFEADRPSYDDWWNAELYVDGEWADDSLGPWYNAYHSYTGHPYLTYSFEDPGTYDVMAAPVEGTGSVNWTVHVEEDGNEPPSVEAVNPDPIYYGETEEIQLDVTDPDGELNRAIWIIGMCDTIYDITSVEGGEDTASVEIETGRLWGCPMMPWVIDDAGVLYEGTWIGDNVLEAPLVGEISGITEPVRAGETLELDVDVENVGTEHHENNIELIIEDDRRSAVDSEAVSLDPGEETTATLTYDVPVTASGSITVHTRASNERYTYNSTDEVDVPIEGPAATITADDQEGDGETLTVEEANASVEYYLEAQYGDQTVQTEPFEANQTVEERTIELDPPIEDDTTVELSVRAVETGEQLATEEIQYTVEDDQEAVFDVSISNVNSPIRAEELLSVTANVQNTGDVAGEQAIALEVDGQSVASEAVSLDTGESTTLTLEYQPSPEDAGEELEIAVNSENNSDSTVVLIEPAEPEAPDSGAEPDEGEPEEDDPDGGAGGEPETETPDESEEGETTDESEDGVEERSETDAGEADTESESGTSSGEEGA